MGVLAATPDRPDRQVKLPWDWEKMPRQVEPLKSITKGLWSIVSSAVTMPLRQRLEGGSTDILIAQEEAIELLARLYEFGDYIAVTTFLRQNPRLIGLLLEAHERIGKDFPDAPVALELVTDPEVIEDRELFTFIRTVLPPDEALRRLEAFDEEWWLEASDLAEEKLCIHVEFL